MRVVFLLLLAAACASALSVSSECPHGVDCKVWRLCEYGRKFAHAHYTDSTTLAEKLHYLDRLQTQSGRGPEEAKKALLKAKLEIGLWAYLEGEAAANDVIANEWIDDVKPMFDAFRRSTNYIAGLLPSTGWLSVAKHANAVAQAYCDLGMNYPQLTDDAEGQHQLVLGAVFYVTVKNIVEQGEYVSLSEKMIMHMSVSAGFNMVKSGPKIIELKKAGEDLKACSKLVDMLVSICLDTAAAWNKHHIAGDHKDAVKLLTGTPEAKLLHGLMKSFGATDWCNAKGAVDEELENRVPTPMPAPAPPPRF